MRHNQKVIILEQIATEAIEIETVNLIQRRYLSECEVDKVAQT